MKTNWWWTVDITSVTSTDASTADHFITSVTPAGCYTSEGPEKSRMNDQGKTQESTSVCQSVKLIRP